MFRKLYGRPYKTEIINTVTTNYGSEAYAWESLDAPITEWHDGMTDFLSRIRSVSRSPDTLKPEYFGYDPNNPSQYEDENGYVNSLYSAIRMGVFSNEPWASATVTENDTTIYCFGLDWIISSSGTGARYTILLQSPATSWSEMQNTNYPAGNPLRWGYSGIPEVITRGTVLPSDFKVGLAYSKDPNTSLKHYRWVFSCPSLDWFETYQIDAVGVYYEPSETGEEEGDEPDVIPIPNLPTLDCSSAGVNLFRAGNFNALINYMWGTGGFYNAINKLLGDQTPYECIVAFNLFPYGEALYTGSTENIHIGNVNTYCTAPRTQQFAEIDFGTVTIPRRFNNALDFAPYTVVELFLPFIGRIKLPTDFVMGKTIGVVYHMDCLTGGCFAFITTTTDGVIQCEGGSCLIQLPISAQTANGARQAISSAMGAGISFANAGSMGSTITLPKSGVNIKTYGESDVLRASSQAMSGVNQVADALGAKDSYSTMGGMSLANGYLGLSNPVVYIHRPINATPSGYNNIMGYPASTIANLGTLSGFTQVKEINLGIAGASEEDLNEIEALLKEGVIL